jgi:hypothetical protein
MSNPVGRPSKYDPKYIDEVDIYLATTGQGQQHMPKIESFAIRIGVSKNTLYEWAKEHKEFQDALGRILLFQGERLIDDGIYGGKEVNATIVKLLLQNNHGMKERNDVTTNDKDLPIPILAGQSHDTNHSDQETVETPQTD